jgi:hypothetical protein
LVDKQGNRREGAVDRADLLPLPSDNPKDAWRKPKTVVVARDESPPKVRIRVKAPPKPAKPAYERSWSARCSRRPSYKVTGIGKEKEEDDNLVV